MPKTQLVGILNVTPDSFSDGGEATTSETAFAKAKQLVEQGADVLDVGAESTRPGATPLTSEEEWGRLCDVWPKLVDLCKEQSIMLSLDSYHAETVANVLGIGCDCVNDVSGFRDPAMIKAVHDSECKLVVMHSQSVPSEKGEILADDVDPIEDVKAFFEARCSELTATGIRKDRIILDPGIGFGKSAEQSLQLMWRINEFRVLGYPLFVGHSRKSFFKSFARDWEGQRDGLTRLSSHYLVSQQVDYLRVHEVAEHKKLLSRTACQ